MDLLSSLGTEYCHLSLSIVTCSNMITITILLFYYFYNYNYYYFANIY